MPHSISPRLPAVLAGAAAVLATAAPAMASEDPGKPPTVPPLSPGLTPVTIPGIPSPAVGKHHRPKVRGARVVPHRVGGRRHATLRLSLSAPGRVRVTITRVSGPRRGAVATRRYSAPALKVSLRLPKRFHGHAYAPGRYRVTVVAVDAQGSRSRPVRRTFVVRG